VSATQAQTVLVTGSSGVVGRSLVRHFAERGHTVLALDRAVPDDASSLADDVHRIAVDLADEEAVAAAFDRVRGDGHQVSTLVNCAALFGDFRPTHQIRTEVWDAYMAVNVRAPFLLMREVLPGMVERGFGRIVNVGSISSTAGGYRQAHYAASKAALVGLSNTVALEYGPRGITSNCVLPGVIEVPQLAAAPPDVHADALGRIPARRFARTEEIVAAVDFLAAPANGYVNGAALPVDGGSALLQLRFSREISF
jgi:NAD(P)-dependent dehydrogenase (short-subunit alcohol dehydrogenase family)